MDYRGNICPFCMKLGQNVQCYAICCNGVHKQLSYICETHVFILKPIYVIICSRTYVKDILHVKKHFFITCHVWHIRNMSHTFWGQMMSSWTFHFQMIIHEQFIKVRAQIFDMLVHLIHGFNGISQQWPSHTFWGQMRPSWIFLFYLLDRGGVVSLRSPLGSPYCSPISDTTQVFVHFNMSIFPLNNPHISHHVFPRWMQWLQIQVLLPGEASIFPQQMAPPTGPIQQLGREVWYTDLVCHSSVIYMIKSIF